MGDWERAMRRFKTEVEKEEREVKGMEKITADLRDEAKRLRQRAWDLARRGRVNQAINTLKRSAEAQKRADDAHEEHRVDILQGHATLRGKMIALSYFAEEFGPK